MLFAQYCRIESSLGGIGSTDREFIKAAHKKIAPRARRSHVHRHARHAWLRSGLEHKRQAEQTYIAVMGR